MKKLNLVNLFFLFLFIIFNSQLSAISFWTNLKIKKFYDQKNYNKVKEILEQEQVDNPNDPELNYNLGDIYYKLGKFNEAEFNFQRAIENCLNDKSDYQKRLKEFSYFNLGNIFYKNCLKILGPDWQKKDFQRSDNKILDLAINEVKRTIENYKKALELDNKDKKVKVNLKEAEKLLKELEEKLKKQKQDKSSQEEQQDQGEKQQKKDGEQKSSKDRDKKEEKGQQDESNNDQSKKEEQDMSKHDNNSQKDKQKQEQQQTQQKPSDGSEKEDNKSEKEKQEKENQQQQEQEEIGQQDAQKVEQISIKEKGMRVLLDDLAKDESKLQKNLIWQQSKGEKLLNPSQKPW
ncbi:MAG: tetratricopeptide repeat protein [Candidatus Babeliales bacterium]